jgi:hypothetical protein
VKAGPFPKNGNEMALPGFEAADEDGFVRPNANLLPMVDLNLKVEISTTSRGICKGRFATV